MTNDNELWIQETFVNETRNVIFSEGPWIETAYHTTGDLFRALGREYGRCVSKMYVGDGNQIGWVFEKRDTYEDGIETYLRHVWVQVSLTPPDDGLTSPWATREKVSA
jgi:hypothetical protein